MKTISTETRMDASPDVVWEVITEFADYSTWNPFITSIEGEQRIGGRLRATFVLPGRKPRTFTPTVTSFEPGRKLAWLGRLVVPGLFDGEHILEVRADDRGSVFVHTEHFKGFLPPLLGRMLSETHDAFVAMDAALKQRAEAIARSSRA